MKLMINKTETGHFGFGILFSTKATSWKWVLNIYFYTWYLALARKKKSEKEKYLWQ